ncbi:hypothetical protein BOX15_Mlig015194g1 [Macrostomum lignano]|uniref:Down syndrome cell adhesion molecule-like protein Dscam2 n=1 Tax=Macrostomum lignano TaxID=282301 RepID=A0A267DWR9_9PLAT|nr:hypothetical protein BOX15_Mlig015194g1 [Macrostomum lignano]
MMLPRKMSTLRTVKAVLNCFSGPLNGSAVCRLLTDPSLHRISEYFNVEYFREPKIGDRCISDAGTRERLDSGSGRVGSKFAAFNAEKGHLHVMSLTEEDARFCYRANITLTDSVGRVVYWNVSESREVRVIVDPSSGRLVSREATRSEAAYELRAGGLQLALPCYARSTSHGGGYQWRRNGAPVEVGDPGEAHRKFAYLNVNSGSLRLRVDGWNDSGEYECRHNDRTLLTIGLRFYKPLSVRLPSRRRSLDHGGSLSLNCSVSGWPISRIFWLHNGRRLPAGDPRCRVETDIVAEGEGVSYGRLRVSDISLSDQGAYQCVAERDLDTGGSRLVPYDSAQDATFLTVNKAPPQLIGQSPELPFAPVFLNGSGDYGRFTCRFRAKLGTDFSASLDGDSTLFRELSRRGIFAKEERHIEDGYFEVSVDYRPTELEHTGRLAVTASNAHGSATCRMTVFAAVHPPVLSVRRFKAIQRAVTQQPFSLYCKVLGGLNSKAKALQRVRLAYPGLRIPTYSLHWQLRRQRQPAERLVLPIDHRMQTDDPDWPDRLHITSMEPNDAGNYTCRARLAGDSGAGHPGSAAQPTASTAVSVVYGISISRLQDQLNLDSSLAIADTCKPINSPTGLWITWWTFRPKGASEDIQLPNEAVSYPGASHSYGSFYNSPYNSKWHECRLRLEDEAGRSFGTRMPHFNFSASLQLNLLSKPEEERASYQGQYTCHIASCFDRKSAVKRVTLKRVYRFLPDKPPNSQEVVLGSPLTVQCAVDSQGGDESPPPRLRWYEGNRPHAGFEIPTYQPGPPQRVAQFPNGTLRIAEVQLADKNFLCSVEGGRSATLNLNIHRPAEVQPFAEPRIELPAGSNSSISCIVKGDRPFNIEWFGQYQAVEDVRTSLTGPYGRTVSWHSGGTTAQILVSGTGGDTLRLINVNQGLRGEYTCRASNQYSRSGDPPSEQHFDVVVVEPPSKVKSLQITDRGHESLTLQWEAPDSNGQKPVIRYRVEYSDRGANGNLVSLNVSAQDRKRRVTGLQPGFNYEFAVSAVNKVGAGPPARCTGSTREQAPSGPVRELRVRAIGSAGLELVWNEPDLMLRNGFITNYTVQFRELAAGGGANCPEDAAASAAGFVTALRCRSQRAVIGVGDSMAQCRNGSLALRAFTDYEVRVTPANAVGPGPPACAVARTLEATPRSPPTNLRCEAKNQTEIFVSWGWPPHESVNGGIQQYHVQYMPAQSFRNEDESQAKEEDTDGRTRHLTIRGLLPHTEYAITVFVSNSRGRSPRILPPKFCTTLPAPPEPPKKLRALGAGASSAVIAWSQTERPNGRLLAYEVSVQPLNRSAPPADRPLLIRRNVTDWPGRHYERLTVRDLRPGGIYEVRVRGLSQGGGVGDFSEPATLAVTEKPPPRIVSFAKTFRVDRGSDVLLDCETVGGAGSQQPIWDFPQVDSSHERLANGSLLIKDVQRDGEFKCKTGQGSDADFIVYSVKAFNRDVKPIPPAPRLLPGRRTSSSLELLWRTGGGRPAGAPPEAAIRQFDLRFSRGAGPQEQRQLSGGNRSYLLDRVDCGASVEFKLRAVNGFDLKSDFAAPLRISALGSAPVAASDASRWLLAHQRRHSVELNFSALLPGDDCPPDRYFVSLRPASGSEGRGFVGQVSRADLSGPSGCCYNLTEALQPGQAYQLTVTAANAAGNSTPVTRRFTASDFGGGGSGDGGSGQDFGKDNTELPTRTSGDGDWSMMFIVVVIVAVVVLVIVVLSIIGCSVLGVSCFACLCCGEAADSSEAVTSPAAASAPASQPFLLEDPPPGISGGLPEVGIAAVKGGRKVTLQVAGGKALPVPPSGAVQQLQRPADCEDDRASIDSEGNLAYYASYNPGDPAAAALAAAAAAGATLRTGSVGHVPTSTRRLQQLRQQRRRDATEARQARDYQGVPTAAQLEQRRSHMSSSTTVSSSRDELSDAYRVGKLRSGFPPGAAAAVAEYEGDGSHSGGSSGGSTDPGILQFTCRPPGPNELRKFTCEVPQSASRRYRRQLSAGTERTYESIDDSRLVLGGPAAAAAATAAARHRRFQPAYERQLHQQQQHRQRTTSEAGCSYGTGVYDSADGSAMGYYSYSYHDSARQQQQQPQYQRRRPVQQQQQQQPAGIYSTYQRSYQQPPSLASQRGFLAASAPRRWGGSGASQHRAAAAAAVEDEEEEDEEEDRQQSRQLLEPSVTPSRRLQQPPPAAAADPADPESSDPAYEEFFTEV